MASATLCELRHQGQQGVITSLAVEESMLACLYDYGFVPGTEISFLAKAPFGGPMSFKIRNGKVAIRQDVAARIFVDLPE